MKRSRLLLSFFSLALIAVPALATLRIVEQAIETSTLSISLPDRNSGSIAVKSCTSCKPILLRLTPQTRFQVGGEQVSYREFVALARGASDRNLGIYYDGKERTITRFRMSGTAPPAAQRRQ